MDLHTVLRSRITAAAVGATVLGVTAALVPTVSTASVSSGAASAIVTWTDSADDFTAAPTGTFPLNDQWYFAALTDLDGGGTITDHATLDEDGVSVSEGEALALVRGLNKPVAPSSLGALVAGAGAETTGATSFGLAIQDGGDSSAQTAIFAVGDGDAGLSGSATRWIDPSTGEVESTSELAADLEESDSTVVGYIVYVGVDATEGITPTPTEPTETPAPTDQPTPAPTVNGAPAPTTEAPGTELESLASPLEVNGQALAADASGSISALRIDDTTTYFTPQPTAAAKLPVPTATLTEATTTGVRIQGSGFAPNELVGAGVGTGAQGTDIPGVAFRADAEGNVSGTIVLPADFVNTAGAYSVGLVGASSAQAAQAALTVTADPAAAGDPGTAPVAVPVPGTATFTG